MVLGDIVTMVVIINIFMVTMTKMVTKMMVTMRNMVTKMMVTMTKIPWQHPLPPPHNGW